MSTIVSTSGVKTSRTFSNANITTTSSFNWVTISSNVSAIPNTGYFVIQGASRLTITLPVTASTGDIISIQCIAQESSPLAAGFIVSCVSTQQISVGATLKPLGVSIYTPYDGGEIQLIYNSSISTWIVSNMIGSFI